MTSQSETGRLDQAGAPLLVFADDGACLEGLVVEGELDEAGRWDLDGRFVLQTDDGERFSVSGWYCTIETGVSA